VGGSGDPYKGVDGRPGRSVQHSGRTIRAEQKPSGQHKKTDEGIVSLAKEAGRPCDGLDHA